MNDISTIEINCEENFIQLNVEPIDINCEDVQIGQKKSYLIGTILIYLAKEYMKKEINELEEIALQKIKEEL